MIVPDLNLLVYAYNADAPHHDAARRWWEETLSGSSLVGLPWIVLYGYVRLMTHPRVVVEPLDAPTAFADVSQWLGVSVTSVLTPGSRHIEIMSELLSAAGAAGDLVTDAVIAALAIEHQATVYSNDLDFGRFPGLKWENPLA